jgi:hypothetical protein
MGLPKVIETVVQEGENRMPAVKKAAAGRGPVRNRRRTAIRRRMASDLLHRWAISVVAGESVCGLPQSDSHQKHFRFVREAPMGSSLDDLETPAVLTHHRREWRAERIAWFAFLAIIVCGLAGYLGPGPLTLERRTADDGSWTLEYQSVEHNSSPGRLVVRVRPAAGGAPVRLVLSRSFCDHVTAESIVPRPVSIEARGDDLVYAFAADAAEEVVVKYAFQYETFGTFDHRAGLEGSSTIGFRQWVLP